ncbi:MAG: transporter substrate-binding domain-containing protein [Labrenzia sp.]
MTTLFKKTLCAIAVLGSVAAPAPAFAESLKIRWGTSPGYEPFIYKKSDGSLTGFDYEIGVALCEELKAECTWVEQAWDGIIPALQAENFDAILSSMSITEKRQAVVDFTDPYYRTATRFVGREGEEFNDARGELKNVKVGVQAGTTQHDYLKKFYPDADIKPYPTQDEVWLDLKAGRVDVTPISFIVADKVLETDKGAGLAYFGGEHTDPEVFGPGAGIAVRKGDDALREKITAAIHAIHKNGTYDKVNSKYFEIDIYPSE